MKSEIRSGEYLFGPVSLLATLFTSWAGWGLLFLLPGFLLILMAATVAAKRANENKPKGPKLYLLGMLTELVAALVFVSGVIMIFFMPDKWPVTIGLGQALSLVFAGLFLMGQGVFAASITGRLFPEIHDPFSEYRYRS